MAGVGMNGGGVSYKLKKSKDTKPNFIHFGGRTMNLIGNYCYNMKMKISFANGFVGFALPKDDHRRMYKDCVEEYRNPKFRKQIRVPKGKALEKDMMVMMYRNCKTHQEPEFLRGLIVQPQEPYSEDKVKIFLVDEFEWIAVPRKELLFAQESIYIQEYKTALARMEDIDLLTHHMEFNKTLEKFVKQHMSDTFKVRFTYDDLAGYYTALVHLPDGSSFNQLIMKELFKTSYIEYPLTDEAQAPSGSRKRHYTIKGLVTHVEKNGIIYVQPYDSDAYALAAWMAIEGREVEATLLQPQQKRKTKVKDPVNFEQIYAAPYDDGGENGSTLYRAKILEQTGERFTVRFVDYGNTEVVQRDDLFLAKEIHPGLETFQPLCCAFRLKFIDEIKKEKINDVIELCCTAEFDIEIRSEQIGQFKTVVLRRDGKNFNEEICQKGWAIPKAKKTSTIAPVRKHK